MSDNIFNNLISAFGDGIVFVPPGWFVNSQECEWRNGAQSVSRSQPVLKAEFDSTHFVFDPTLPNWSGHGRVFLDGRLPAFLFGLQAGPNGLYWLADATDPHVWSAMEQWDAAGQMVLTAEFDDGNIARTRSDFRLSDEDRRHRESAPRTAETADDFALQLLLLTHADAFRQCVPSVFAQHAELQHAQFCMVCTPDTPPLRMSRLQRVLPTSMAHSLRDFLEQSLGLTGTKH